MNLNLHGTGSDRDLAAHDRAGQPVLWPRQPVARDVSIRLALVARLAGVAEVIASFAGVQQAEGQAVVRIIAAVAAETASSDESIDLAEITNRQSVPPLHWTRPSR